MKKKVTRRAQRFQVNLPVAELNGQPVDDTMLIDISSQYWARRKKTRRSRHKATRKVMFNLEMVHSTNFLAFL